MSSVEEVEGVCETCGRGTHIGGEENRLVCDGCDMPTTTCSCSPQQQ